MTRTADRYVQIDASPESMGGQPGRPARIVYPENRRYRRIRALSVLMDQSIVLPSGYRIGLDPLLGLLPGVGDILGALVSCYLVYESTLLGLPKRVIFRMLGNVAVEALAGSIPLLGDIFDAAWKANMRNLRLLDQHYHPALPGRSPRQIAGFMLAIAAGLVLATCALLYAMVQFLLKVIEVLSPF